MPPVCRMRTRNALTAVKVLGNRTSLRTQLTSEQLTESVRRQTGTASNPAHGNGVDRIVAGNDEPLFAIRHHDVPTLPGNMIAQFFKNSDSIALIDARNFWHGLNGNQFAGNADALGGGLTAGVLLGNFEP